MGNGGPLTRVPLEALILAFAHSRAKTLVGTDALRSVLSGQYRELNRDGDFDLEPVWQLLAQQPGFDPDKVRPALCRFKTWEGDLGVAVRLPAAMADLGHHHVHDLAAAVMVPPRERARVLDGAKVLSDDPEVASAELDADRPVTGPRPEAAALPPTIKTRALHRFSPSQRRTFEIASLVLGILGFIFAGLTLQRSCRTHDWEQMSTHFAGEIPIAAAERQGPEVSGTLRDGNWLGLSGSVRTSHMKAALEALPRDVQVFFVRDQDRQVRAVARWFGQPRQISVTLQ